MWAVAQRGPMFYCLDQDRFNREYTGGDDFPRENYLFPTADDDNLDRGVAITMCDFLNMRDYGKLED